jgi:regulator of RNase E activity RraA
MTSGPAELSPETFERLRHVSTATLTSQLLRRGLRSTFIRGLVPTRPDLRLVGRAFTLRYVPAREDLAFQVDFDNRTNVQRLAVESVGTGDVLVIDARGELAAASLGEILATRIAQRGAAGIVTDGCLRDSPGFAAIDLPVYYRAPHASLSSIVHHPVDLNVPIGCGGVLVLPGDVLVGDAEGVVVVPADLVAEVAEGAVEQELLEEFAIERVRAGETIVGLYPLGEARRADYERWLADRQSRPRDRDF